MKYFTIFKNLQLGKEILMAMYVLDEYVFAVKSAWEVCIASSPPNLPLSSASMMVMKISSPLAIISLRDTCQYYQLSFLVLSLSLGCTKWDASTPVCCLPFLLHVVFSAVSSL